MTEINRTLLIDDHAIVRSSLGAILKKIPSIHVIGEAETGWQGIMLARKLKPELVILDYKLPDISGLEVTQRLLKTAPELKIMILTAETHDLTASWLLAAGAQAYLKKSASTVEFSQAIENLIHNRVEAHSKTQPKTNTLFHNLSFREVEIMRMMVQGETVELIAQRLFLDTKTVYDYRSVIFKKLQVKNVVDLALLVFRHGIMAVDEL